MASGADCIESSVLLPLLLANLFVGQTRANPVRIGGKAGDASATAVCSRPRSTTTPCRARRTRDLDATRTRLIAPDGTRPRDPGDE